LQMLQSFLVYQYRAQEPMVMWRKLITSMHCKGLVAGYQSIESTCQQEMKHRHEVTWGLSSWSFVCDQKYWIINIYINVLKICRIYLLSRKKGWYTVPY
jgi:hypothetical protein